MSESSTILVGLEIGTSKVCAVVGDLAPDGSLNIVGLGQARSHGVRKGEIVDAQKAEEDVRQAIAEAEQMADLELRSVYLGVTGGHVRGFRNHGMHPIASEGREIKAEDVQDVLKNAKTVDIPGQNHVIHAIRQHFAVDGQEGIPDPTGMLGARLEVDVHIVHGKVLRLQNAIRTVKSLQLEVDAIVFNGLASALALLTTEQKELGALVIDIGGGATEYVLYADGVIRHTGVLAVGGDHVSNDLAQGLKVLLPRAETLKIEHGAALADPSLKGQTVRIPGEKGLSQQTIKLENLRRIMSLRLQEIFQLIAQDLSQAGPLGYPRAGVFLCGGGARIPQIAKLAEQTLDLPVTLGKASSVSGLCAALDQPEFATAIGLVKFGCLQARQPRPRLSFTQAIRTSVTDTIRSTFGHILQHA
jgi:cell division protein FtsA